MSQIEALDLHTGTLGAPNIGLGFDPEIQHCIQCGSCSGVCPVGFAMEFPPSRMISLLRAGIYKNVTQSESVWLCIACSACTTNCPTLIPITESIMAKTKEELILAGNIPAELQIALENSQRYRNPMGESPRKRADWIEKVDFPVPILSRETPAVDVLWFVGDYGSYHQTVIPATIAFARIINELNVNFGILGNQESSDGDSQRLAGEQGLFEMLAEKNGRIFKKFEFKEIITTDPHAFNAFKNAYPEIGISYPARHYSQFLVEKIEQLKPMLKTEVNSKVTFHDPCYLGRVNGIYEEPRELIQSIPGVEFVEMFHNLDNSLCCGGGGGGMWLDGFHWEKSHARSSEWRVKEAVDVEADIMVVACPYEKPRFQDATKNVAGAENMKILDLSELLVLAME
jgi:dimethylglycine catabolism B